MIIYSVIFLRLLKLTSSLSFPPKRKPMAGPHGRDGHHVMTIVIEPVKGSATTLVM